MLRLACRLLLRLGTLLRLLCRRRLLLLTGPSLASAGLHSLQASAYTFNILVTYILQSTVRCRLSCARR